MHLRKTLAVGMSLIMLISVFGCGKTDKGNTGVEITEKTTETKEDEEPATTLVGTGPAVPGEGASETDAAPQFKDGESIVDINFDDDDVDGFMVYTNGGTCDIAAEDGKLAVTIKNCGSLDYANQVYWDGFMLSQNCVYTYSFDISSDIERKVEYRLQLNGGDYHAYQGEVLDVGTDVTNFSVDFEMTEESDPAPRIVFNMGKMEDMSSDPGEHKIYIDNIKLTIKDASKAVAVEALPQYVNVAVNQVGYKPGDDKIAVVKTENEAEESFIVCNAESNETVFTGKLSEPIFDYGADMNVKKADFSELKEPGTYYLFTEEGASYSFEIKDNPYDEIYEDTFNMLYKQRCGMATDEKIAGEFAHDECHTGMAIVYGTNKKKDVTGGWHDAGDYGRYTVPGAVTIADLFMAYEDFDADTLDEARYELDFLLKMQDEESGGVYHKVTCLNFPETVDPEEETEQLYLAPVSVTATADFAAIMAKASVIYKDKDKEFSENALAAAEKAWEYLMGQEKLLGFRNPEEIVTGEYPDSNTSDEMYWAATELYLAGADVDTAYIKKLGESAKLPEGLGWADIALYADYDLAKQDDSELAKMGTAHIVEKADTIVENAKKTGYGLGFGSGFVWGSNMAIGNEGELLLMAANLTDNDEYDDLAARHLDYLLGTNSLGYCFVTGFGTFSPKNPHHRPSQVKGKAMSGMLVGGANRNLEDPYAMAVLAEEAPAMCYVDNDQSFSTNEITIYWNSPLIYLLAAAK